MIMRSIKLFIILTFALNICNGQITDHKLKEKLLITTNGSIYAINENINYSIFYLNSNNALTKYSKIAYIELISEKGYSIIQKKSLIKSGIAKGSFIISDTLSSGYYKLIAYTTHLKYHNIQYIKRLYIYNPEKDKTKDKEIIKKEIQKSNIKYKNIEISNLNDKYITEDSIKLYLNSNTSCIVSVTVRKNIITHNNIDTIFAFEKNNRTITKPYISEEKGVLLRGEVFDTNKKPYKNSKIYLNYIDSIPNIEISETNYNGEFTFWLNTNNDIKDLVLSVNDNTKKYFFRIYNNFSTNSYNPEILSSSETIDTISKLKLRELYINNRISVVFKSSNNIKNVQTNVESDLKSSNTFYFKPDESFYLNDYITFKNISEFIHEIPYKVKVTNKNKKQEIRILSLNTEKFMNSNPAIFINGIFMNNDHDMYTKIFNLDMSIVFSMDVIYSKIFMYDKTYDGIINFNIDKSFINDLLSSNNYDRIIYKVYDPYHYKLNKINQKELPNFNNTLYWNPNLSISSEKKEIITFNANHDFGDYTIYIIGVSTDGQIIYQIEQFKIIK